MEVLVEHMVAVVVIARVFRYDAWVRLARKRGDYVAKLHVGEPGHALVSGLARPHPVAWNVGVTLGAAGGLTLVIPDRQKAAVLCDREVGLPLSAGTGICVQFEWRAKGRATIGGTDVEDVGWIAGSARV